MRAMAAFCVFTICFLVYRDLALPHVSETEVWFGFELHGWLAKATAPLHWAIFGIGAMLFWRGHPRAWLYASGYAAYIALSHLIWNLTSASGGGVAEGLIQLAVFSIPAAVFFWLHRRRGGSQEIS